MTEEYTTLIPDFSGTCIVYAHCENCGQPFTCQTYRPYNYCGYCGLRILWNEDMIEAQKGGNENGKKETL